MCEVLQKYVDIAKAEGMAQGKAEGMAQGLAEGKAGIAKKMIASGFTDEQVSDLTGLSVEEIAAIRNGSAA